MRKFTKGGIESIVDDNDSRIPAYLANGWKEEAVKAKPTDVADAQTDKALADVAKSEGKTNGKGKGKTTGKKVNDAIKANSTASAEAEPVDDGLLNTNKGDE